MTPSLRDVFSAMPEPPPLDADRTLARAHDLRRRHLAWITIAAVAAVTLVTTGVLIAVQQRAGNEFLIGNPSHAQHPWQAPNGDTLIRCAGQPSFPESLLDTGGVAVSPDDQTRLNDEIRSIAQEMGPDAPLTTEQLGDHAPNWIALWNQSGRMGLLLAPPGEPIDPQTSRWLIVEREQDSWRATSWGDRCSPEPALPLELQWAQVTLPADAPDPAGTQIEVEVTEDSCTSGRNPEPYLREPLVVETDTSVTIYWTSQALPLGQAATCPGNPSARQQITLAAPLADRQLLDGSTWPAQPVRTEAP